MTDTTPTDITPQPAEAAAAPLVKSGPQPGPALQDKLQGLVMTIYVAQASRMDLDKFVAAPRDFFATLVSQSIAATGALASALWGITPVRTEDLDAPTDPSEPFILLICAGLLGSLGGSLGVFC